LKGSEEPQETRVFGGTDCHFGTAPMPRASQLFTLMVWPIARSARAIIRELYLFCFLMPYG
jgi:hypothetical protein